MDIDTGRPLFVVSDLHLGNGSCAFARQGKDRLLRHFLDHVHAEGGQLLILGDLLELWRFRLEAVLERWSGLLDQFHALGAWYVPGNHDAQVVEAAVRDRHPLFTRVRAPFRLTLGERRIQFLHGHEIDPLIETGLHDNRVYRRCFRALYDLRERVQWVGHEALADLSLGFSEFTVRLWQWLTQVSEQVLHPDLRAALAPVTRVPLRDMRTCRMLSRTLYHRDARDYDVAVMGHTHRVGRFGAWYFNSGCWVKPSNSFLRIDPDGDVRVYDWLERVARRNRTVVGGGQRTDDSACIRPGRR